jgi:hypothetical protein
MYADIRISAKGEIEKMSLVTLITILAQGSIAQLGLEVYKDEGLTIPLVSVDYGRMRPNEEKSIDAWIKVVGDTPAILELTTGEVHPPEASQYLALTWDYVTGTVLNPNDVVKAVIKLSIGAIKNIPTYDFKIIIIAREKT